jgi:hypothetical protein
MPSRQPSQAAGIVTPAGHTLQFVASLVSQGARIVPILAARRVGLAALRGATDPPSGNRDRPDTRTVKQPDSGQTPLR